MAIDPTEAPQIPDDELDGDVADAEPEAEEPRNDVVEDLDPEAETAAGTEPRP